jgi:hypothetical protein
VSFPLDLQFALIDDDTGELVAFILPEFPDHAPDEMREGLVRRRLAALHGRCPCDAPMVLPNRAERRRARTEHELRVRVDHHPECPGDDHNIAAALARWER